MATAFAVRLACECHADSIWQLILRMSDSRRLDDYFGGDKTQLSEDLRTGWIKCFLVESAKEEERRAVGFCIASLAYDTWISQYLTLSALYVEPEYRGKHLCTALVTAACRFAISILNASQVDCTVPVTDAHTCLLYTSPSPRDLSTSRMPSSA